MPLKLMNLGLPKSGTTTLGQALTAAGLRVADWKVRAGQSTVRGYVGRLMYDGWFSTGDPWQHLSDFDAATECSIVRDGLNLWPQTDWGLISALRHRHPGIRFVLTVRPAARISDSMGRWSNLGRRRLPDAAVPGLPEGYGATDAQRIRWIEGHHAFCRQVFAGADDFLELPVEAPDARDRLAGFLGIDLPWWGVANANTRRAATGDDDRDDDA
jgi:hypothetical protein